MKTNSYIQSLQKYKSKEGNILTLLFHEILKDLKKIFLDNNP